ncbi:MAG TPA: ammonium transporter [Kofleriaceae bacterium]|nr:ammonium transporter [Kofleriaceae bacterium]
MQANRFSWAGLVGLILVAALATLPRHAAAEEAPAAAPAAAPSEPAAAQTAPAPAATAEPAAPAPAAPAAATAPAAAPCEPAAAAPSEPTIEQRLANLEAYVTNGAPDAAGGALASTPGPGHNGWMMVCAALVLFMTLPGLGLFYGGLVRRKNVLSVLAQCLGSAGLIAVLWWSVGYSLVFSKNSSLIGGFDFAFLEGVTSAPNGDYAAWVSQNVFSMFQMMFAIITPALIVGAIAERMKFSAVMAFIALWMFAVYFPLAHMVWGADGLMNGVWNAKASIKAIDFAGGTVVHMSSGWSALVLCLILGKRTGFGKRAFMPHSLVLTMVGTGMLWVGWYGFNAGSAVAADGIASNAFVTTTLAAAVACAVWPALEWITRGKPTVLGFCSGAVAGLVVITPCAGFVSASSAMIIGVLAGVVPFLACTKLKAALKYDDALDTFGVHGVGGTMGAILAGVFADASVNGNLNTNLKDLVGNGLWLEQLKAVGLTMVLSIGATVVIGYALKAVLGLRPSVEAEEAGLDDTDHGEAGYHLTEGGGHGGLEDLGLGTAAAASPALATAESPAA